jgi:hypothetical protein
MSVADRPTLPPGVPPCRHTVVRAAARPKAPWSDPCHGPINIIRWRLRHPTDARPGRVARPQPPASSAPSSGTTWCCRLLHRTPHPLPAWSFGTHALLNPCCSTRLSPSVGHRPRRCIGIAGPWRGCPCGPSRCLERPGSSFSPRRVGSASPKWHCWRGASWHIPRPRSQHCRPASGIALPVRRPVGCAASWPRCIFKTCQSCHSHFAKNRHLLRTCPQASAGIADRKGLCPSSMTSHSLHDPCCYRKVKEYSKRLSGN